MLEPSQLQFVIRLPARLQGFLWLEAAALDGSGCKVATGTLEERVPGGLRPYVERTLTLASTQGRLCPLTVKWQGDSSNGSIAVTPLDRTCSGGEICEPDFPYGTPVTLSPKTYPKRTYTSFSGDCLGADTCALVMDRARTVTVSLAPRVCSPDNWCWYSPLPHGNLIRQVWGTENNDIWAVGDAGTILHWDGYQWSQVESKTTNYLLGVWGSSSNDVWAVGVGGTVLHWDGTAWNPSGPLETTASSYTETVQINGWHPLRCQ
jgi:hypothetical protein